MRDQDGCEIAGLVEGGIHGIFAGRNVKVARRRWLYIVFAAA